MNRYKKLVCIILGLEMLLILSVNALLHAKDNAQPDRLYRVEANRVAYALENTPPADLDLSKYETIVGVREFRPEEIGRYDYVVAQAQGVLYRIEYEQPKNSDSYAVVNAALGIMFAASFFLLVYLGKKIVKPFFQIRELPAELAKGNLSMPVQEEKSKFFGKFLWGMDMLRDKLETGKARELALHKEKKTLLLSLTHDIKTPLSAIRLNTKAVSENLYGTEEKRQEALARIQKNVTEIENYVNQITRSAREDFLDLEVVLGEVYVSGVLEAIREYYEKKLSLLHTEFLLQPQSDCLVQGDRDRIIEVLQNVMENAIKYGDGKWIRISGENEEDCRLITIENSGSGVKEEEIPNLFDSFYRGGNSQGIQGSGLGLYICKQLMQQMDGEIYASPTAQGFAVTVVLRKV